MAAAAPTVEALQAQFPECERRMRRALKARVVVRREPSEAADG